MECSSPQKGTNFHHGGNRLYRAELREEVRHKGPTLYDSNYVKCPEQENSWRKKVD